MIGEPGESKMEFVSILEINVSMVITIIAGIIHRVKISLYKYVSIYGLFTYVVTETVCVCMPNL